MMIMMMILMMIVLMIKKIDDDSTTTTTTNNNNNDDNNNNNNNNNTETMVTLTIDALWREELSRPVGYNSSCVLLCGMFTTAFSVYQLCKRQ